jgi:hypothetical protein
MQYLLQPVGVENIQVEENGKHVRITFDKNWTRSADHSVSTGPASQPVQPDGRGQISVGPGQRRSTVAWR